MDALRAMCVALLLTMSATACAPLEAVGQGAALFGSGTFVSASGQSIRADYRNDGTVTLTWPDGQHRTLVQAVSASGARYIDGMAEWWEHHGEATFSDAGRVVFTGLLVR